MSSVRRLGLSAVDGVVSMLPASTSSGVSYASVAHAVAAGVPAVRLTNVFVKQFGGAEWLKKSRPAVSGFMRMPEMPSPPDSFDLVTRAQRDGTFGPAPPGYRALKTGPVRVQYSLIPDRDLNGAGLVYFANYPVILDIAERDVLETASSPIPDDLLDRRTIICRRSAYLKNTSARDVFDIYVELWLQVPPVDAVSPEIWPVRLCVTYRMMRQSDQRVMMISRAEKIVMVHTIDDLVFAADLLGSRARD